MERSLNNSISSSLLIRSVYNVCFTLRENPNSFHDEFCSARKKFFSSGKRSVKIGKDEIIKGFDGKLQGKITRKGLYWKKSANKTRIEESYQRKGGYLLVKRDFRGSIVSRMYFSADHTWIKSEYFDSGDPRNAKFILKPCDSFDGIEQFEYLEGKKRYRSVTLYPVPYQTGTAEQSLINANFGEPAVLLSTAEGDFCYCDEAQADARLKAAKSMDGGTVVFMPAWEVKDGNLSADDQDGSDISFTTLEECAKIESRDDSVLSDEDGLLPEQIISLPGAGLDVNYEDFFEDSTEEYVPDEELDDASVDEIDDEAILRAADIFAEDEPAQSENSDLPKATDLLIPYEGKEEEPELSETWAPNISEPALSGDYPAMIVDGRISQPDLNTESEGITAYEGGYADGKREGFGTHYYKDGSICYAGFWKQDKKDGLGVSFRGSDHALHVAKWNNGQPEGFVSLFSKEGDLRYSGRIENGKKHGAGVTYSQNDGTVFVGQWDKGEPTGYGSSFDKNGRLLYTGSWENGKPNGTGTEFDVNGEIIFSGQWKDGKYHNGILYKRMSQQDLDAKQNDNI